jgi:hypothetical protein
MWGFRLRCFALLGAGAIGLHELRYLIGYGGDAGHALAAQGHGYLDAVTATIALALVAALAVLIAAVARGGATAAARSVRPWRVRWLAASGALLAVFVTQELVEGALSPGHAAGLAGVTGNGGWIAVPLALAIGAVVAALLRGAEAVIARFAHSPRRPRLRPPRVALPCAPLHVSPLAVDLLAAPGAPRAPPLLRR